MADYTEQQYKDAARKALAAGDNAAAKRLIAKARAAGSASVTAVSPDGPPMITPEQAQAGVDRGQERTSGFLFGDDNPDNLNAGEALGTLLNMGGESMTLGLVGDEAAAKADELIGRGSYDERLQKYRNDESVAWRDYPALSMGAVMAPAAIPGLGIMRGAAAGASLPAKAIYSGILGGLAGGTYGFMEGEGGVDNRIAEGAKTAGLSGVISAGVPIIGALASAGVKKAAQNKAIKKAAANAPTSDGLRRQGQAAYQAVDDLGVQIKPSAFARVTGRLKGDLTDGGLDTLPGPGSNTPKASRTVQKMDAMNAAMAKEPTAALPFSSVDQLRRNAGAAASDMTNKVDQKLGVEVIEGLDDFIRRLAPDDVTAGDAKALGSAIEKARDTWSRMSKSQLIDDAIEAGGDYLSGEGSGIRNQFKNILRNKKLSRGFTDVEKKLMRRVVSGSLPERMLNLASGGLGQMATVATSAGIGGAGGPVGAGVGGLLGMGIAGLSRRGADALTARNAEIVRSFIANGGSKALPPAQIGQGAQKGIGLLGAILSGSAPVTSQGILGR